MRGSDLPVPDGGGAVTAAIAPPALGPGDDDPRSPAAVQTSARDGVSVAGPLGPGDDDPRSPVRRRGPATARAPHAPGESVGENPDDAFEVLVAPALGPGAAQVAPRSLVRIPKRTAVAASAMHDNEKE